MELQQLLRELRRNIFVAIATFAVCLAAGGAAAFLPTKQYKATATVLAQPAPGNSDPAGAVAILEYLVPQLPTEAINSATVNAARGLVPSQDATANIKVDSISDSGTGVLTIDVTSTNPRVSAAFANAVAQQVKSIQPKHSLYELSQVSPAQPPSSPTNSKVPIVAAAAGFGIILAVFAALGAAEIRRRLSRVAEIKGRIGVNVLGEIPRVRGGRMRPSELHVSGDETVPLEAFQELRSNILLRVPTGSPASIAVTSCGPAEGKTSVAANLGWALASEGRPATVLDCDLRHPNLHVALDVPYGPGVSSPNPVYAIAQASLTKNANLQVIPAGIPERHPSDIMSANLPTLLDKLRKQQRTVIIDCPPLIGAAETILIAAMVDVVIVVVDTRRFNAERLQQCILRLQGTGNAEVGVVLNRVRFGRKRRQQVYQYSSIVSDSPAHAPSLTPAATNESAPAPAAPRPTRRNSPAHAPSPTPAATNEPAPAPAAPRPTRRAATPPPSAANPSGRHASRGVGSLPVVPQSDSAIDLSDTQIRSVTAGSSYQGSGLGHKVDVVLLLVHGSSPARSLQRWLALT